MSDDVKYPKVTVELIGQDGNAFAIIGRVQKKLGRYLKDQGADSYQVNKTLDEFREEAMSGDYDNVLQTAMRWVVVE